MKKFNENIILLGFAIVFVFCGLFGNCFYRVAISASHLFLALVRFDGDGANEAKTNMNQASSELLSYHDMLMDIDSIRNNILGTRVVYKEDIAVVKADCNTLIEIESFKSENDLDKAVFCINELEHVAEDNGAYFLYCAVPTKNNYVVVPSNVNDFALSNYSRFVAKMEKAHIPVVNFSDYLDDYNVDYADIYYQTEHHWKVEYGFYAAGIICQELNKRYGYLYNKEYTDIHNFNFSTLDDWFLGAYGKKVGTYFTWDGPDDFDLITPKFKTNLIFKEPLANLKREGTFEESVLFMENVEKKDLYNKNPYATYCGGDHRLQVIKNTNCLDGKKIIIIRDSFASVVSPFLSLQTNELHICDMRDFIQEEKINMADYIREQKPDYVICLFSGVPTAGEGGRLDFF